MAISKPSISKPLPKMDYWQLTSQIQQTLAETGGVSPQSPTTVKPITITKTDATGNVTKEVIPAGTSVADIKAEAQKRLAEKEGKDIINVDIGGEELNPPGITIPMTQSEITDMIQHNEDASCAGEMQKASVYNVNGWDDNHKWVTITVQATDKDMAKAKAVDAGYDVKWVNRQIGEPTTTKPQSATNYVKDYLTEQGAWKEDYLLDDGFNIALMYSDSVTTGAKFRPVDLEKWFGKDAVKEVSKLFPDNVALPDGLLMKRSDFESLPKVYRDVLIKDGYKAYEDKVKATGGAVNEKSMRELEEYDKQYGTNYAEIAQNEGYNAVKEAIDNDVKARESAIAKLEKYKTEDGYNLLKARVDGVKPDTMRQAGFDDKTCQWVDESYQTSLDTHVALPGNKTWENVNTGKIITV